MRTSLGTVILAAALAAGCGIELGAGVLDDPSSVSPTPTPTTDTTAPTAEGTDFPCDVRAVLETNCAPCHGGDRYITPLTTRSIWLALRFDGMTIGQYAASQVAAEKMPPPTARPQPSPDDRALLIAWVEAGMPPGACGPLTPPPR